MTEASADLRSAEASGESIARAAGALSRPSPLRRARPGPFDRVAMRAARGAAGPALPSARGQAV